MSPLLPGEPFEDRPSKSDRMGGTKKEKIPFKKAVNDDWVSEEVSAINDVQARSPKDVERCKPGVIKPIFKVMMNSIYSLEALARHGAFFKVLLKMESKPSRNGTQGLRQLSKPQKLPTQMP